MPASYTGLCVNATTPAIICLQTDCPQTPSDA